MRQKFKIGTILFRGAKGVPVTTPKLSYFGMWEDIEFGLNYVSKKYVCDPKTKEKRTRMYSFGVSLGGQVLLMYLGKAGKKACELLDGALVFSAIWETRNSSKWFVKNLGGFYDWLIGKTVTMGIKSD